MANSLSGTRAAFQDVALLVMRIVFGGAMMAGHGLGKAKKVLAGDTAFGDPVGLGVEWSLYLTTFAEVVCAAFVIIGLFTRLAAIPLIIAMGVVVFVVKIQDPFGEMELPLLYFAGFVLICAYGPGKYSIDGQRKKL